MGTVEETKSRLKYALNLLRIVMYPKQLQIIDTQAKEASATDKHKQYLAKMENALLKKLDKIEMRQASQK